MIEISPAILTDDETKLAQLYAEYGQMEIGQIDIDIAESRFVQHDTVAAEKVLQLTSTTPQTKKIGYHLMLAEPQSVVDQIIRISHLCGCRIYVHAEANYHFVLSGNYDLSHFGLAINPKSELSNIELLQKFSEIQFMTVEPGLQGNPFVPEVGQKVQQLCDLGYIGKISLDGGINLETIDTVKTWPIDRVSVGSFLQNQPDLAARQAAYQQLVAKLDKSDKLDDAIA